MEDHCGEGLFDLDSTLAAYADSMAEYQELMRSPGEEAYIDRSRTLPAHVEERRRIIQRLPGFWRNLKRLPLGFDILEMATQIGFKNSILTQGPQHTNSAWTEKKEWCDEHVPGLDVHISQDKSAVYGKFLVDDWPPYFMEWLNHRPRGLVICVEQSWNKDVDHPRVIVYNGENKEEVYEALMAQAKR